MEDATLAISKGPGLYFLETPRADGGVPVPSYGIMADRQSEEPPDRAIDTESLLEGRFDILGKYGYVDRMIDRESDLLREARRQTSLPEMPPTYVAPDPLTFFNPMSGRAPGLPCTTTADHSFFRPDPNAPTVPYGERYINDTRLNAKDAYDASCSRNGRGKM
jgi:hypothetical protein